MNTQNGSPAPDHVGVRADQPASAPPASEKPEMSGSGADATTASGVTAAPSPSGRSVAGAQHDDELQNLQVTMVELRSDRDRLQRELADLRRDAHIRETLVAAGCPHERAELVRAAFLGLHPGWQNASLPSTPAGGAVEAGPSSATENPPAPATVDARSGVAASRGRAELQSALQQFIRENRWMLEHHVPPTRAIFDSSRDEVDAVPRTVSQSAGPPARDAGVVTATDRRPAEGGGQGRGLTRGREMGGAALESLRTEYADALAEYREQPSNAARQRVLRLRQQLRDQGAGG